jgi:hypothetical protein
LPENLKEGHQLGHPGIDGRVILNSFLRWKLVLRMWTNSSQVPVVDICKQYNEPSGSIRGREFLDSMILCS